MYLNLLSEAGVEVRTVAAGLEDVATVQPTKVSLLVRVFRIRILRVFNVFIKKIS